MQAKEKEKRKRKIEQESEALTDCERERVRRFVLKVDVKCNKSTLFQLIALALFLFVVYALTVQSFNGHFQGLDFILVLRRYWLDLKAAFLSFFILS